MRLWRWNLRIFVPPPIERLFFPCSTGCTQGFNYNETSHDSDAYGHVRLDQKLVSVMVDFRTGLSTLSTTSDPEPRKFDLRVPSLDFSLRFKPLVMP